MLSCALQSPSEERERTAHAVGLYEQVIRLLLSTQESVRRHLHLVNGMQLVAATSNGPERVDAGRAQLADRFDAMLASAKARTPPLPLPLCPPVLLCFASCFCAFVPSCSCSCAPRLASVRYRDAMRYLPAIVLRSLLVHYIHILCRVCLRQLWFLFHRALSRAHFNCFHCAYSFSIIVLIMLNSFELMH